MVPKGWKLTSLGEICNGNLQTGPFGSQLHAHEYVPVGIPVLMPKDLIGCRAKLADAAKINQKKAQELKKHFLKTGDLLFSRRGDVARFALIDEESEGSICGTGCLKARPSDKHSSVFLAYFLQKDSIRKWLEQNAVGQTMPNMNTEILNELPLMTASSKQEEDRIAQILSTWDKAISVTEKLLANSQRQKKALMQQLLTGNKRLLDENGGRFIGEWCTCTLSEVAHIIMGSSPKSEAYNDNGLGLPLIQGNADIKCRVSCPRVYTSDITKECTPGDILLSVRAPVGTVALSQHKACIGRGISAIKSKRKMSQSFLYQWFLWFEPKWCYLSQGSTFESINSDDIKTLKLSVPNFEEQQKIAAVLSAADAEISTLEKKLACLKEEKKALMQQLLTGKRRVKMDEAVAA
ncbi:restriction endonuclease subunit S [Enterobacter roggenkampii]|uniref:restriction endonuclease subunit S n=1 Tax=Enterobacter roggenkampii TaxID=1812935 RepID=UPI001658CE70|nr:restriction endonuclease subunit S [Enterobacter roggenkampii]QNQ27920.1 restriction endonuclease subunit S [Enterobacter roggenkampii]HCI5439535.1 restriction endonuclease subunit S [Enterobacter roggenkampii]